MTELIALLTPAVGMGIQWITALCSDPPVLLLTEFFIYCFNCALFGKCSMENSNVLLSCLMKK